MRHEQRSVSLVESASKSQPLIEDISHFEDTVTPARDSEDDSNVEEIEMESPPYIPAQRTASSCSASSRDAPARPNFPSSRADTSSSPFQASADFNVSPRDHSVPIPSRPRIVTGFGAERIDDVASDEQRRLREGARRGTRRRETGERGRMRDFDDNDLDRAAGGAWHAGKRG